MKTNDFFLHGNQQLDAALGPNSATAVHKRRLCVTLPKTNMNIYVFFPTAAVSVKMKFSVIKSNVYREQPLVRDISTGQRK